MSLSLALLPFLGKEMNCSHEIIQCPEDLEVYDLIQQIPMLDVSPGFRSYLGKEGYGSCTEDRYGNPLMFTRAMHLKTFITHPPAKAFLEALADDWPVALYWH